MEKQNYLARHLTYEIAMMRYTSREVSAGRCQYDWNALVESFWIHARNLYAFLASEDDARNFQASDFVPDFRAVKNSSVAALKNPVNALVLHMGKARDSARQSKLNNEKVQKVAQCLEHNLLAFSQRLGDDYRKHFDLQRASPPACSHGLRGPEAAAPTTGPTGV